MLFYTGGVHAKTGTQALPMANTYFSTWKPVKAIPQDVARREYSHSIHIPQNPKEFLDCVANNKAHDYRSIHSRIYTPYIINSGSAAELNIHKFGSGGGIIYGGFERIYELREKNYRGFECLDTFFFTLREINKEHMCERKLMTGIVIVKNFTTSVVCKKIYK